MKQFAARGRGGRALLVQNHVKCLRNHREIGLATTKGMWRDFRRRARGRQGRPSWAILTNLNSRLKDETEVAMASV